MPKGVKEDWQNRFWQYVSLPVGDCCWEWLGSTDGNGYGTLNVDRKPEKAHRLAWKEHYGDIPLGMFVCHTCDNRRCVRYDHLFLGTNDDNMKDASKKRRVHEGEANGLATLTWEEVYSMRRDREAYKLTYIVLADKYGVAEMTAWNIVNKRTWKD